MKYDKNDNIIEADTICFRPNDVTSFVQIEKFYGIYTYTIEYARKEWLHYISLGWMELEI